MDNSQLKTPVAFLIYNRPYTTAEVFAVIRQAKPSKLLVVADGPHLDRANDFEKCKAARAVIDQINWDCEVLTNYSDVNLGCKNRVSSGLDWVFNTVEEAIILEDDCLPHITFFEFCEAMLNYYRNDKRIMSIVGCNFQLGRRNNKYDYYFSRLSLLWGWATWRRAWQYYDYEMNLFPSIRDEKLLRYIFNPGQVKYWTNQFQETYDEDINSWGYRWMLSCLIQNGLTVTPNINLVSNIGFDVNATHTINPVSVLNHIPVESMSFPLSHPLYMIPDIDADNFTFDVYCKTSWSWNIKVSLYHVVRKLKSLLHIRMKKLDSSDFNGSI